MRPEGSNHYSLPFVRKKFSIRDRKTFCPDPTTEIAPFQHVSVSIKLLVPFRLFTFSLSTVDIYLLRLLSGTRFMFIHVCVRGDRYRPRINRSDTSFPAFICCQLVVPVAYTSSFASSISLNQFFDWIFPKSFRLFLRGRPFPSTPVAFRCDWPSLTIHYCLFATDVPISISGYHFWLFVCIQGAARRCSRSRIFTSPGARKYWGQTMRWLCCLKISNTGFLLEKLL